MQCHRSMCFYGDYLLRGVGHLRLFERHCTTGAGRATDVLGAGSVVSCSINFGAAELSGMTLGSALAIGGSCTGTAGVGVLG